MNLMPLDPSNRSSHCDSRSRGRRPRPRGRGLARSWTVAATGLAIAMGHLSASAEELVIGGSPAEPEIVQWEAIDGDRVSTGARIGDGPDTVGTLIVGNGVEWTNDGGFYVWNDDLGQFAWTDDTIGLLIGSVFPSGYSGDELTTGMLILETGSIFHNTGDVVIGRAEAAGGPVQRKRGVVTIEQGAVWNNAGLFDEDLWPHGLRIDNGELNVQGQLNSQIDVTIGGASNAAAVVTVDGPNAQLVAQRPNDPFDPFPFMERMVIDVDATFGATAELNVINGGTIVGQLQVATGSLSPTGQVTIGNGGPNLSHADLDAVWVGTSNGANGTLIVNDQGRVDAIFGLRVGGNGGQGLIQVNDGGLIVIPGGTLNFPRRAEVMAGGVLDVSDGGKVLVGNGLDSPESLTEGTIHLGFGGRLVANGQVVGDVQMNNGSSLIGTGTILGNINAAAGAIINPGNSIGLLTIDGNLDLDENTILTIEVNSLGNDQLVVTGLLTLGGTLNLAFIDGFEPEIGQSFQLDIFNEEVQIEETSTFAGISLAGLPEGLTIGNDNLSDLASGQPLAFTIVPEPTSLALLTLGALLATARRQRPR